MLGGSACAASRVSGATPMSELLDAGDDAQVGTLFAMGSG